MSDFYAISEGELAAVARIAKAYESLTLQLIVDQIEIRPLATSVGTT